MKAPTRHTAPPAKHGLRDLGFGLLAAFCFCGFLNGCATQPPSTEAHALKERDARTRHQEPGPSHIH